MPKGGKRAGAGRPRGSLQKRHKVIVEDPTALMPVEWMLAVLRDPEAEQSRRDRMAEVAAPYLHARLATIGMTSTVKGGDDVNIVQIFAVPRGAALDVKAGTVTIDGIGATELPSVEPYAGTPALTEQGPALEPPHAAAPPDPLPALELGADNVTRLDTFKRDRED
jgi:hypothetical protein